MKTVKTWILQEQSFHFFSLRMNGSYILCIAWIKDGDQDRYSGSTPSLQCVRKHVWPEVFKMYPNKDLSFWEKTPFQESGIKCSSITKISPSTWNLSKNKKDWSKNVKTIFFMETGSFWPLIMILIIILIPGKQASKFKCKFYILYTKK